MKKIILLSFTLLTFIGSVVSQTRYVSSAGSDLGNNNCTDPNNACASISYAVTKALSGDSVLIEPGTYNFSTSQLINKGTIICAKDTNDMPIISSTASDIIQVTANNVTIKKLRIEMGLTSTSGLRGIVASGTYNNLMLRGNEIISTKPIQTGMVFTSYGILASGGAAGQIINIMNNIIKPLDASYDGHGRAVGIGLSLSTGPGANIQNNELVAYYPLQTVQNTANLNITNNNFIGQVLMGYPINNSVQTITNNTFDGYDANISANILALLELRAVGNAGSAIVQNNNFVNYSNIGFFSSACKNILVKQNTFSPLSTATAFVSIHANTKLQTVGPQNTNYVNKIDILGNTFNAGSPGSGTAISYANHAGVSNPAFQDSIKIGGSGVANQNVFDNQLDKYIVLDNNSGPSSSLLIWTGNTVTNMLPFSQKVYASTTNNIFNLTNANALQNKIQDSLDFSGLGRVITTSNLVTPSISIASSTLLSCAGNLVTFSIASQVNQGSSPTYNWKKNNISVSSGTTYSTTSLISTDVVTCELTSSLTNVTLSTVTSNSISVSIIALPNVTISGNTTICNGLSTTLNASGATSYLWNTNQTSSSIIVSPTSSITYSVTGTTNGCSATSSQLITVNNCPGPQGSFPTGQCGYINNLLTGTILCNTVVGATGYLVKFYTLNTNTIYAQKISTSTTINFSGLTPSLQPNTQYDMTVTPIMPTLPAGVESQKCLMGIIKIVTSTNIQPTYLTSPTCVSTSNGAPIVQLSTQIKCAGVPQASTFQFRLENVNLLSDVFTSYQTSPARLLLSTLPLTPGATYKVTVRATVGGIQAATFGPECFIKIAGSVKESAQSSITFDNNSRQSEVLISPNPVANVATINFTNYEINNSKIEVYNAGGLLIESIKNIESTNQYLLDMSKYSSGNYIIHFVNNKQSIFKKIIKI